MPGSIIHHVQNSNFIMPISLIPNADDTIYRPSLLFDITKPVLLFV